MRRVAPVAGSTLRGNFPADTRLRSVSASGRKDSVVHGRVPRARHDGVLTPGGVITPRPARDQLRLRRSPSVKHPYPVGCPGPRIGPVPRAEGPPATNETALPTPVEQTADPRRAVSYSLASSLVC